MCVDISRARDEVKIVRKDQSKVWRVKEMIGKLTAAASPPKEGAFRLHYGSVQTFKIVMLFLKRHRYFSEDLDISGHPSLSQNQTVPQYLGTVCSLKWDRSAGTNSPGQLVERGCAVPLCNSETPTLQLPVPSPSIHGEEPDDSWALPLQKASLCPLCMSPSCPGCPQQLLRTHPQADLSPRDISLLPLSLAWPAVFPPAHTLTFPSSILLSLKLVNFNVFMLIAFE